MASSALAGIFAEYELTLGGQTVTASLKPTTDARAVHMADVLENTGVGVLGFSLPMRGRLVSPLTFPPGVRQEMESPMTYGGRSGVFRLGPLLEDQVPELTEELGQPIIGVWRSH